MPRVFPSRRRVSGARRPARRGVRGGRVLAARGFAQDARPVLLVVSTA